MADDVEIDGDTILFPTRPAGGTRYGGLCFLVAEFNCVATGLDPAKNYRATVERVVRRGVNGEELTGTNRLTSGAHSLPNAQGDWAGVVRHTPSGVGLPTADQATQFIGTVQNNSVPYDFTYSSLENSYFEAKGGAYLDQIIGEYIMDDAPFVTYRMGLQDVNTAALVAEVEIPIIHKVKYMMQRDYVQGTSANPVLYFDCDFDTPLNPLQSASAITTTVDRATIPYNKTTEREVIHLDNRLKSTS